MRERYEAQRATSAHAPLVERFCRQVEQEARATINAKSVRLLWMLRNGYYPNPHDEARERAQKDGGSSEDYLREQQGSYYLRRVAFERSFKDGEQFRYASLNLGGTGLAYYGPYCLVLRDPIEQEPAALLPANSLQRFVRGDAEHPQIDEDGIHREVSAWPNRHHLATCKHADDLAATPAHDWPKMMCHATDGEECFVEVILGFAIAPDRLVEMRVGRGRLDELMAAAATGTLRDDERVEYVQRLEVLEALRTRGLSALYVEV